MVYAVLVREDLQTTLEEESQVAVPSRDSSATCLCLSLRNGEETSLGSARGEFERVLGWRCWNGLLGGRHIIPAGGV